jgi:hypothetical protein
MFAQQGQRQHERPGAAEAARTSARGRLAGQMHLLNWHATTTYQHV